uniref:DksA C4-type domain-containing protein n=1 Tax=Candidatus Methanomethylicus mesodigestus TaxID=1867258 RepID=A0A7C3EWL9_9CREN
MDTMTVRRMLQERRQRWEATADHMAEQAMLDSESNFSFHLALRKLQAIDRNEKRLAIGAFGWCERCGALIDEGKEQYHQEGWALIFITAQRWPMLNAHHHDTIA